ncbi:nuclear transport factor 2 family protein [Nocardioides sp. L-11A]|uniref:nuclear transport factor 2 family protein n=1 Tax=Nocardioides sp. L-11A TaxID=3043848 RepID=UPI00249AF97B|nr:nuclear transport factor 2 family protein [Nocardioides sp. L-11A]
MSPGGRPHSDPDDVGVIVTVADIVEVHQLIGLYCMLADSGTTCDWTRVFDPEASLDMTALGGSHLQGVAEIAAFFALGSPPHPPAHQTTNPYVWLEDSVLRSTSTYHSIDRASSDVRVGQYDDVYTRAGARLRILRRVLTPRWMVGPSLSERGLV